MKMNERLITIMTVHSVHRNREVTDDSSSTLKCTSIYWYIENLLDWFNIIQLIVPNKFLQ